MWFLSGAELIILLPSLVKLVAILLKYASRERRGINSHVLAYLLFVARFW